MEQWSARGLPEKKEQVKGVPSESEEWTVLRVFLDSVLTWFSFLSCRWGKQVESGQAGEYWQGLTSLGLQANPTQGRETTGDYRYKGEDNLGKKSKGFSWAFIPEEWWKKWEAGMCIWMRKLGSPAQYWNRKTEQCPHSTWVQGRKRNEKLLNTHKLKLMLLQATWIRNSKYSCAITIMFTKLFTVKWL